MVVRRPALTGPMAVALALAAVLVVGASPPEPRVAVQSVEAGDLAVGTLLVAARSVRDPIFAQTVILLIDRSESGTAGLILNRRTPVPVERLLPDLPRPEGPDAPVYFGGPVVSDSVRMLLRFPAARLGADRVLSDVFVLGGRSLEQALEGGLITGRLRVYAGYAGWSAGQLEGERHRGDWHLFEGDGAIVFDPEPETLWRRQIRRTELFDV